jgi:hypothetical protein
LLFTNFKLRITIKLKAGGEKMKQWLKNTISGLVVAGAFVLGILTGHVGAVNSRKNMLADVPRPEFCEKACCRKHHCGGPRHDRAPHEGGPQNRHDARVNDERDGEKKPKIADPSKEGKDDQKPTQANQ